MKIRGNLGLAVVVLLLVGCASLLIFQLTGHRSADGSTGKTLVSRSKKGLREVRDQRKNRTKRAERVNSANAWAVKPDLSLDSDDESKLKGEMKRLFVELQAALDAEKKQKVFALVEKMQTMDEWPDDIPLSVKLKALEALKWFGADGIPAVVGFSADSNPEVQQQSVEALTEMLSDASLGDRATSEILKQLVKVVTDADALDTMMMSLNDMRNSVRVDTARAIYNSGNETAIKVMDENVEFFFCDGDVEVRGRGDLDAYLKANPDDPDDEDMYGPPRD